MHTCVQCRCTELHGNPPSLFLFSLFSDFVQTFGSSERCARQRRDCRKSLTKSFTEQMQKYAALPFSDDHFDHHERIPAHHHHHHPSRADDAAGSPVGLSPTRNAPPQATDTRSPPSQVLLRRTATAPPTRHVAPHLCVVPPRRTTSI